MTFDLLYSMAQVAFQVVIGKKTLDQAEHKCRRILEIPIARQLFLVLTNQGDARPGLKEQFLLLSYENKKLILSILIEVDENPAWLDLLLDFKLAKDCYLLIDLYRDDLVDYESILYLYVEKLCSGNSEELGKVISYLGDSFIEFNITVRNNEVVNSSFLKWKTSESIFEFLLIKYMRIMLKLNFTELGILGATDITTSALVHAKVSFNSKTGRIVDIISKESVTLTYADNLDNERLVQEQEKLARSVSELVSKVNRREEINTQKFISQIYQLLEVYYSDSDSDSIKIYGKKYCLELRAIRHLSSHFSLSGHEVIESIAPLISVDAKIELKVFYNKVITQINDILMKTGLVRVSIDGADYIKDHLGDCLIEGIFKTRSLSTIEILAKKLQVLPVERDKLPLVSPEEISRSKQKILHWKEELAKHKKENTQTFKIQELESFIHQELKQNKVKITLCFIKTKGKLKLHIGRSSMQTVEVFF